ncbi:MAG: tetratricopeptide repeat protein, partial [Acutalibacteraceae bacterium]
GSPAVPKKVAARYAKTYASLLNYSYANSVVEEFFSESDLKNPIYKKLSEYSEKNDCYSKIMEIINEALQNEENGADEICAKLEEIRNDEGIDAFLIDYYKYIVVQYFGETAEKQYDILTSLIKEYPDKWPLNYELCAVCARLGRADESQKNLNEVIKYNSEDGAIYAYLADAYRFCEEPDPDKMLEAVAEGEKADGDTGYAATDLDRVKAVAYLLKGDFDSAYDCASSAYQMACSSLYYGYSINNLSQCLYTYQLCAHLKGDEDAYDSVVATLGYAGIAESEDIKSFIKGTSSLEDIITDGEGDLA